ncbi:unnamed protein product [Urochloa humidicola]
MREGMSPSAGAKKRLGLGVGVVGGGGFGLGCGCRDAKAVAVAASASSASPYSATGTDTSTATTATWRGGARTAAAPHHSSSAASGSTGTLTVPSASSSSFLWEDADGGDAGEEEVDCGKQRESTPAAASFSGLLRQLNELEQSVVSWGRKSTCKDYFSPPPASLSLPARPVKQRGVDSGGDSKEDHRKFSPPPPPPPPLPARPVKQRVVHSGGDGKEGQGNFSPPPPPPTTTSFHPQMTQQHRKAKNMDEADRQAGEIHSKQPPPSPPPPPLPLPPEQPKAKSMDKDVASIFLTSPQAAPKHRKAKSCDGGGAGKVRLEDGSMAVVKQSEDPLSDFRRSMVNMVVENRIATGDELRELLRHFLALNAPHHHDAIVRAFTEIWDEAFSVSAAKTTTPHRDPAGSAATRRPTPPRPRTKAPTPPRRRLHAPPPPRVWR